VNHSVVARPAEVERHYHKKRGHKINKVLDSKIGVLWLPN